MNKPTIGRLNIIMEHVSRLGYHPVLRIVMRKYKKDKIGALSLEQLQELCRHLKGVDTKEGNKSAASDF